MVLVLVIYECLYEVLEIVHDANRLDKLFNQSNEISIEQGC